jgi:hypothetical protein
MLRLSALGFAVAEVLAILGGRAMSEWERIVARAFEGVEGAGEFDAALIWIPLLASG